MYREVRMVEINEVLRLWRAGVPKKRIAARLGLDPKTVRRYVTVAADTGLRVGGDALSDDACQMRVHVADHYSVCFFRSGQRSWTKAT
jgi:hypothetical protein